MKKIELEIVALSHSITQTNSYAVVLGEVNGLRKLPIVIGGFEAQAIAVALERMKPTRPLTHDLMKNFMMAFTIDLHEVIISDLQEGIFIQSLFAAANQILLKLIPGLLMPWLWPFDLVVPFIFMKTSSMWQE
jgi:bifunctional DNase/RNase